MAIEFLNGIDLAGDLELKKADPKIILYDDSGANGTPNGEIVFSEADNTENFKLRYNGLNDRFEYWGLISGTSTLVGYWNRSTDTSLHSVGTISTGSDGSSANWKTAYDHSQAAHAPTDAEANVQADWTETTTTSDAFILNKPTTFAPSAHNHNDIYYTETEIDNNHYGKVATDAKFLAVDGSSKEWIFEVGDESAITGNKWYKIATVNQGNGGLHIRGLISNHVESFASQKVDIGIVGREGGSSDHLEITGQVDVLHNASGASATDKCGIRIVESDISTSAYYHYFDVYVRTTRYQMLRLQLTKSGNTTFHLSAGSNAVTTEPAPVSGGTTGVEIDTSTLQEGNYVVDNSTPREIFHEGHKPQFSEIENTPTTLSGYGITDAEANVQADWTETTTTSDAFILNKPTIPTIPTDFVSKASGGDFSGKLGIKIGQVWDATTQGKVTGSLHIDPELSTDHAGGAITFGASDSSSGENAQAGIYIRSDGSYGTRMYFSTTDSYATGSKTAMYINHDKDVYFLDNINVAGDITVSGTVDGVDISALPTSYAPTDAEANVQANWTETTTTSDAFILNKPTIPTDHGDHDGLYIPVGGGTITSGTSVGLTINHDTFEQGLVLHRNHASNAASIVFKNNGGVNGSLFAIASDGAPYWQYNDSTTPNYRIHTANDFTVADVTGALPKAGGTMTGTLVMSAVNPEIHFNGTSDTGVDMAIKATPEGLDFYEPEESNKIHFQILDDTGVNAVYGYKLNGTMVISSSRVLANVTGNISMFTNDSGYLTRTTPNAPTTLTTTIVNSTINVGFTASTTTNIDYYLIFSSVGGGDYGLISVIPPTDFGATMSVIDNSFDATGTQAYRVYAVKNGVYSTALTGSQAFAVTSAEPTNMSVVNLNKAYYVQWDPPSANARFITAYNVYKHEHATQASLDRDSATLIYSGLNTSYMYQISGANNVNYHQFWVETTIG